MAADPNAPETDSPGTTTGTERLGLAAVRNMFPGVHIIEPPDGTGLVWGWRTCNVDMTSSGDFRWPYPGAWCEQDGPANGDACGQGLHIAKTVAGATSAGYRRTVQIVAYSPTDVLGEDHCKLRVKRAWVGGLADLHDRLLPKADLGSANLRSANLRSADLSSADLRYADLSYANLSSANLRSADLRYADLSSADLRSADLRYADLSSANLRYADLSSADLSYADLRSANLRSADLRSANLRSANLGSANLRYANLRSAPPFGDEYTVLPDGWKVDENTGLVIAVSELADAS